MGSNVYFYCFFFGSITKNSQPKKVRMLFERTVVIICPFALSLGSLLRLRYEISCSQHMVLLIFRQAFMEAGIRTVR